MSPPAYREAVPIDEKLHASGQQPSTAECLPCFFPIRSAKEDGTEKNFDAVAGVYSIAFFVASLDSPARTGTCIDVGLEISKAPSLSMAFPRTMAMARHPMCLRRVHRREAPPQNRISKKSKAKAAVAMQRKDGLSPPAACHTC
uniref:Uncharacterized protein n=1 Tax=Panagrellus redivivus TaxID=6233 RepID=A0A7E4V700_PANRE